jgi:acyl-CoA thioester hydrolase
MEGWIETCRSVVSPWECDVTEHFTIAYYFDRLADAAVTIEESLGLLGMARNARRGFNVRFVRELRAGASFHIVSAPIMLDKNSVRFGHQILNSGSGEVTAWVEQTLDGLPAGTSESIPPGLASWGGPEFESRPEPSTGEGFIPTVRDRIKPVDLEADGKVALAAFVHRFTAGLLQALAAIGATSSYMEEERRGFSTFELRLGVTGSPRLGDAVLVDSAIVHLGNTSMRLVHRLRDPAAGTEFARLDQYGVLLDLDARRPAPLPEEIRAAAAERLVKAD